MKTQISRDTFDPEKRYSAVFQQMGRMLTDADWNELSDINKDQLVSVLTDIIGTGTPKQNGIIEETDNGDGTFSYQLKWGNVYVDGVYAQLVPNPLLATGVEVELDKQQDLPLNGNDLPSGDFVLYLDVWERAVTWIEDGALRDPGLRGADTCTRSQTMAQVKWCELSIDPEDDEDSNPKIGNARLTLALRKVSSENDECDPCLSVVEIEDKVGNYLFRVEVDHVVYDENHDPQSIRLKWSRENGAELYEAKSASNMPAGFVSDKWAYEFFAGENEGNPESFASEKHLGKHLSSEFIPARGELVSGYPDSLPNSWARRWDGYCTLNKTVSGWTLDEGFDRGVTLSTGYGSADHGYVAEGNTVTLALDTVTLNVELADWRLLAGDYWIKEIREAIDQSGDELLIEEMPRGVEHHYMVLGRVIDGEFEAYHGDECQRLEFPPLTDIEAKDVCYENTTCEMPEVETVQDAIDHLCQEKDLSWHNKHLHGWGIVCGLIGECGPDTLPDPENPEAEPERQEVRITSGYALDCNGNDLVVDDDYVFNLIDRVTEVEDEEQQQILTNGSGTLCLRLDGTNEGIPDIGVERYDNNRHGSGNIFEGTLLQDFFDDCLIELVTAIQDEFTNGQCEGIEEIHCEGHEDLVSFQRKKAMTFFNLAIQYLNNYTGSGNVIFLSHKEHLIIRCVYLRLREILQSKTFCAMFEDQNFPEYPFSDRQATTFFGRGAHTRVKVHPNGDYIYTYGSTDNTINVYHVTECGLVEVIEMPSAGGAEITAITFSQDGGLLYAVANLRGVDSIFGMARIEEGGHVWEKSTVFCNLSITEMQQSHSDPTLIYAIGYGTGLYFLHPEILFDQAKPQPIPVYDFNAIGHMELDEIDNRIYATWQNDETLSEDEYDRIAILDLEWSSGPDENRDVTSFWELQDNNGNALKGTDGLTARPDREGDGNAFIFVQTEHPVDSTQKSILVYRNGTQTNIGEVTIEDNSELSLEYHRTDDALYIAVADGYRLQRVDFTPDGEGGTVNIDQIPVQVMPVDLAIDRNSGQTYILNYGLDFNSSLLGNSITSIPQAELAIPDTYIDDLIAYHSEILVAFLSLISSLVQYIKDCFCHHFLVKCPTCDNDDIIYLATIEVQENKVVRICNFDKRKTVKSFDTVGYWMSVIPVVPLVKKLFEYVCCSSIPGLFGEYESRLYKYPTFATSMATTQRHSLMRTQNAKTAVRTYQRTDTKAIIREQSKSLNLAGKLVYDGTIKQAGKARVVETGVKKEALVDSQVSEAVAELQKNNIQVTTQKYEPKNAGTLLQNYAATPSRIKEGEKVTIYEENGKVVMYAVEKQPATVVADVTPEVQAKIEQLEQRKSQLSDFANLDADLARVEARKNSVLEMDAAREELAVMQTEKNTATEELAALRAQTESLKAQRETETLQLNTMKSEREALTQSMQELNQGLQDLTVAHNSMRIEINKSRPVSDIADVTPEIASTMHNSGILTVNDLATAEERTIVEMGLDTDTARKVISDARLKLN